MSVKKPLGDPKLLTRRTNPNPKFSDVESVLDTGNSVSNVRRHQVNTVSIKQQPGELFRRMRPGTLAMFVQQELAKAQDLEGGDGDDYDGGYGGGYGGSGSPSGGGGGGSPLGALLPPGSPGLSPHGASSPPRPPLAPETLDARFLPGGVPPPLARDIAGASAGIGGGGVPPAVPRQYLVLDVREKEDYDQCHIAGAQHYPPATLNRQNPWSRELFHFKNRADHTVVVYDLDEEVVVGKKVGNLFFERGVDNVVTISGGLKEFVQNYAQFVVGTPPVRIVAPRGPAPPLMTRTRDGGLSRGAGCDTASTRATSVATSHKPKALASSLAKRSSDSPGGHWH